MRRYFNMGILWEGRGTDPLSDVLRAKNFLRKDPISTKKYYKAEQLFYRLHYRSFLRNLCNQTTIREVIRKTQGDCFQDRLFALVSLLIKYPEYRRIDQ